MLSLGEHLGISGDIYDFFSLGWRRGEGVLACSGQEGRILTNFLQCTERPPQLPTVTAEVPHAEEQDLGSGLCKRKDTAP